MSSQLDAPPTSDAAVDFEVTARLPMKVWWCDAPDLPGSAIGSSFDIRLTPHPITKYGPPGKRVGSGSDATRTASAGSAVAPATRKAPRTRRFAVESLRSLNTLRSNCADCHTLAVKKRSRRGRVQR